MAEVVEVFSKIINLSLRPDFKDFEDSIQHQCALSINQIKFIVTRNVKDFKNSALPVLNPIEALSALENENDLL